MIDSSWGLVVARPTRRALDRLSTKIAVAVVGYLLGPLLDNPHRVGKPLRSDLSGLNSARVGAYHTVYEIDIGQHTVKGIPLTPRRRKERSTTLWKAKSRTVLKSEAPPQHEIPAESGSDQKV